MSKRSDRRAAERTAHQANRTSAPPSTHIDPAQRSRVDQIKAAIAGRNTGSLDIDAFLDRDDDLDDDLDNEAALPHITSQASKLEDPKPQTSASESQINANRENAKKSTGPYTVQGKRVASQNRRSHGLTGRFMLLGEESPVDYQELVDEIYEEYKPKSATEVRLAHAIVTHYWMMNRSLMLQEQALMQDDDKKLCLYMRYHSTHERSYYKAQKELQKLQKERSKETIGSESQKRKDELQEARVRLTQAKAEQVEVDTACRQVMQAPTHGSTNIGFEQLAKACSDAIAALIHENQSKNAA